MLRQCVIRIIHSLFLTFTYCNLFASRRPDFEEPAIDGLGEAFRNLMIICIIAAFYFYIIVSIKEIFIKPKPDDGFPYGLGCICLILGVVTLAALGAWWYS